MSTRVIILAAGKGTRMKSRLPKVLHPLAGKPMLSHVLDSANALDPASITVVIGHEADTIRNTLSASVPANLRWAEQAEQLGTAHAVSQGLDDIGDADTVLVTYGDIPLTRITTYQSLVDCADQSTVALLTLVMDDPTGYGRIVRDAEGQVTGIVEQKDATEDQLRIGEINSGVLAIRGEHLKSLLPRIDNQNAQGEYYLTDLFSLAVEAGLGVSTLQPQDAWEVDGVNSREQLAALERVYQWRVASSLMAAGVSLADPARIDVRGTLHTGQDVSIDVGCVFTGDCQLADGVQIGAGCVISNSTLGAGTIVQPYSVIDDADIGSSCAIGPFARIRPGTELATGVRVGNFVETKNARVAAQSKINHLSYVGDSTVGERVNIGAGTITCNYDGANKHTTTIEADVFVGSNSALVAPVTLGAGSTVGAGTTVSRDVPDGALVVTRAERRDVDNWQRPKKKKRK